MSQWLDVAARNQLDPDFPLGVEVSGQKIVTKQWLCSEMAA
jgi:hypothetical protein